MIGKNLITETNRLILRGFCKDVLQDLYEYLVDEDVGKYEPYKPMSLEEVNSI